jgi:hypothetical protein
LFVVVADALAIGSVLSMSIPLDGVPKVIDELFPALSVQVPVTVPFVIGPFT